VSKLNTSLTKKTTLLHKNILLGPTPNSTFSSIKNPRPAHPDLVAHRPTPYLVLLTEIKYLSDVLDVKTVEKGPKNDIKMTHTFDIFTEKPLLKSVKISVFRQLTICQSARSEK
jgi:hypothetical protein